MSRPAEIAVGKAGKLAELGKVLSPRLERATALALIERIAAVHSLSSSVEYLARREDRTPGGVNNWGILREEFQNRPSWLRRALDVVGDGRVTDALHAARVASAAAILLLPASSRRTRLIANLTLASTTAALRPRHRLGGDGADQVSFVIQTATAVARAGGRRPQTVDACLWFIALQSVLSYTASGWAKMTSHTWRSGQALPAILGTRSFGDRAMGDLLRRHPGLAKTLSAGVLTLECGFPLVFAARGRLAPAFVWSAAAFHIVNGRVMGLGRFAWSFIAMHPAILYVTREPTARRYDLFPVLAAAGIAGAATGGMIARIRYRGMVKRGRGDERHVTTSSGNRLTYRRTGPSDGTGPVIVFECGLLETAELHELIASELAQRCDVIVYSRAGYGSSIYGAGRDYSLEIAVRDLIDLIDHLDHRRPVIVAGHALGGHLAFLAAHRLPDRVRGVCLIDPTHPTELPRSTRSARKAEELARGAGLTSMSVRFGWGWLLRPPEFAPRLPGEIRKLAVAQYRDPRHWAAGRREWHAWRHLGEPGGKTPVIQQPMLMITSDRAHQEFRSAVRAEVHVLRDVDHDLVARLIEKFAAEVSGSWHR